MEVLVREKKHKEKHTLKWTIWNKNHSIYLDNRQNSE